MKYKKFLIKYAEIALKGSNRHLFEDALLNNIRKVLKPLEYDFELRKDQGRIYLELNDDYDYDTVIDRLKCVFGIVGICPMIEIKEKNYEAMSDAVSNYMKEEYGDSTFTFKVMARRADKSFPLDSMKINVELGGVVLETCPNSKVDVHKPEVSLFVEVRDKIYIYSHIIKGSGGMPVGTAGKAMLLLSGGIDSPVAGHMIAKRGVTIEAVYFHAPPYTSERAKQKVVDLAKIVAKYSGAIKLHIVNFTDIQLAIYDKCPHDELTIIMRRYMMKIAEHFAKEDNCLGLVTGESIGQVASQTMKSLIATNDVCELPVFRPLCGMDKQEIIDRSLEIGAYETSILPYEDCCTIFVAKHPVTKPNLNIIKRSERNLDDVIDELMEKAIETTEVVMACGE